jgi:molecular chaperone GrpE
MNDAEQLRPPDAPGVPDQAAGEAEAPASLEELSAELAKMQAGYARAMADYQNLQRRSREDRAEQTRLTMKALLLNYLPVLDDLNRALDMAPGYAELADHPFVEGVRMVQRKFLGVLEGAGVRAIEAGPGVAFDPQQQEAVGYGPGPLNEIVAVVQGGYAIDNTVIRPAMVIVGNGEPPSEGNPGAGAG